MNETEKVLAILLLKEEPSFFYGQSSRTYRREEMRVSLWLWEEAELMLTGFTKETDA